jgi:hypothetical protein
MEGVHDLSYSTSSYSASWTHYIQIPPCCFIYNWNFSPNAFEYLQVCQWWKALLAIHSRYLYWLLRSAVLWRTMAVIYDWKGEVQHAVRMVLDLLLLYVYYSMSLQKRDMFARVDNSVIQTLDVFSSLLECPLLHSSSATFYKPWNVMTGLMQFSSSLSAEVQLRLVSISKYSMGDCAYFQGNNRGQFLLCGCARPLVSSCKYTDVYVCIWSWPTA